MTPWTVILAAGESRRFGAPKLLQRIGGTTLLQRAINLATQVTSNRVIVILGCNAAQILEQHSNNQCQFILNEHWSNGMGTSLACAANTRLKQPPDNSGLLVMLADQVALDKPDLQCLIEEWQRDPNRPAAASYGSTLGPPVIFPEAFLPQLASLDGDSGAKSILQRRESKTLAVAMANAAFDIDTAADLERLEEKLPRED